MQKTALKGKKFKTFCLRLRSPGVDQELPFLFPTRQKEKLKKKRYNDQKGRNKAVFKKQKIRLYACVQRSTK